MMNQSERDDFDEQWRNAFEEASETPPPSLWNAIEEQLDEKKKNKGWILPLWWNAFPARYAAAVAVVLLAGWSVWSTMNQNLSSGSKTVSVKPLSSAPEQLAEVPSSEKVVDEGPLKVAKSTGSGLAAVVEKTKADLDKDLARGAAKRVVVAFSKESNDQPQRGAVSRGAAIEPSSTVEANVQGFNSVAVVASERDENELQLVQARGFQELPVYPQRRYVFYRVQPDDYEYEELRSDNKSKKEYWAAVGLMPSSFDPQLNVKSAPLFSNLISQGQISSNSTVAETSTSEARLSYSVQAQTGVKISKNWSIETGISYLQGNSVFKSDGYALDRISSRTSNVLESALYSGTNNKAPEYMLTTADVKGEEPAGLYIDVSQKKSNEYRYLQVPVQVGYTLNPSGKMSYTVLGGMVGNIFLQNQLETNSGYVLTTKAEDNVYRSLNWAGSSGLRLNFRVSPHWTMNMTGSFQKSIMTIFKDNDNLESKPQLYGVGWGMRYTF
jgi:hypothetical protein